MTDPRDDGEGADPPADGGSVDADTPEDDGGSADTGPNPSNDSSPAASGAAGDGPPDADPDDGPADADPVDDSATERAVPAAESVDSDERAVVAESVETPGEPRTLHPRVRITWLVGPLIGAVAAGLAAGAFVWFGVHEFLPADRPTSAVGVLVGVFLLFVLYGAVRTQYLYRSWRYVVREESLYLTRGVFTKVQTVVPYVRVQHIDTRRSAFERALGLSTLVVYTAGSRGADVTIPGLTPETAEDLQSRLERLAIASEDEDAV